MRTHLGLDERPTGTAPSGAARKATKLEADAGSGKPAKAREHKLGATARSFAILEHVASARAPVDVLDIISSVKLPKATAYRLVDWFISQGYLAREPGRRRLIIGPKLTNLAFGALSSSMRHDTPHVVLQRLVHTLNETCNIGTLLNGEVVYLDRVEAEHWPLRLHYAIGSRVPLHCSAIGKLYLAMAASPRRRRLLQSLELRRFTDSTITDSARLDAELRQIRKEQVSFDRQEYLVGVVCMAAPITGRNGEMLAALAVQAPEARMNLQTARRHLPTLRDAASELAEIFQDKISKAEIIKD
jgi:IclR family transcriptional regulator, acetate operon repressor